MGALENITGRIKKEAKQQADLQIKKANSQAKEILKQAQKETEKEKKSLEQETEKNIGIQRSRAVSEAKLEARKVKLRAKEEVISSAFEMAHERLKNIDSAEKERYLKNAVTSGVNLLGKDVEVLCNPADSHLVMRIASEIGSEIRVSSEGINYLGGAVIRAKDGSSQIDVTFEGVLERMRNELRKEVADKLFQKEPEEAKEA